MGRVNQYLVRNNHPGIISREQFGLVQRIRDKKTKNPHKSEDQIISPYAYYLYSVDLGKYLNRIVERYKNKYKVEMLLVIKDGKRVSFRFEFIKEGIKQMAKYIVDNKTTIKAKLMELKKPSLGKLELEKVRLCKSLEGLPLSERLETYGKISDILLRIEKMSKLSEMIENYIRIARKLYSDFDILLTKQLFSSININDFNIQLIISCGNPNIVIDTSKNINFHGLEIPIKHCFKEKTLKLDVI